MNKTYKVVFTPAEPFFFGNEKSFIFRGQEVRSQYSGSYFMKSEEMPSQSAILGVLRYIFLLHKGYDPDKKAENDVVIGEKSFDIDSAEAQEFGIIKKISPVFVQKKDEKGKITTLIPTPFDHQKEIPSEADKSHMITATHYTPFSDYSEPLETIDGQKIYANDFDVKVGIADSFTSISDGKIYTKDDIFKSDLRIGINRASKKDGFFKKEYKMLKPGFGFAVYADLDIDKYIEIAAEKAIDITKPQPVFMGQGKSAFSVSFVEQEDTLSRDTKDFLEKYSRPYSFVYCLGDSFISKDPYVDTLFAATSTKDYRAYKTVDKGNIEKGKLLHRLLKAGSVFITENAGNWVGNHSNFKADKIGFNTFVTIGE